MTHLARRAIPLLLILLATAASGDFEMVTFHAQIVVDQGVPPASTPQILPQKQGTCIIGNIFGNGVVEFSMPAIETPSYSCPVTVRLSGYRKNDAVLTDGAVIVMRRPGSYSSPTVSLTTLAAPENAKRAFRKGVAAQAGKKWAAAQKEFERAVAAYPDYAPAWGALGEVLVEQSQTQPAREAFKQALKADQKFAPAWAQLARLAADEGRMQDSLYAAECALQLDPTGFPEVYVSQATADLALDRLDAAEKSARRAIELDTFHEIPRAERVLGSVLAAKGDHEGAIQHWKKYLDLSPKAEDAPEVRNRIAEAGQQN